MTDYQKLVLKALAQILRGLASVVFYKNEKVSDDCYRVAIEIENTVYKESK